MSVMYKIAQEGELPEMPPNISERVLSVAPHPPQPSLTPKP